MLNAIELLQTAIATPSVSGREAEVAAYFVSQMRTFADNAFIDDAGNAVATLGQGSLNVYFLGHIDTVPGDIAVRVEEGELWGRGSVDAKGSFCTAVAAASQLDAATLAKLRITLIGATEEEAPTSKGARYALGAYDKPDLVIIGEPSNWDAVTLGYKGRLVVHVSVEKENFHSAGEGTTAAEDLVKVWQTLKHHADTYNENVKGIFSSLQIALQHISSQSDGLTQQASATVGYRLPTALTPQALQTQINALLDAHDYANTMTVRYTGAEIAYRSDKDTPLTRAFRIAIREHGATPRLKVKTGTSDMNVVAPDWQVPMLAYGPGDSALDHTPEERLSLDEYKKAIAVLATAFKQLASSVS